MNKTKVIIIAIVVMLMLSSLPEKSTTANLKAEELEAYAVAGLFAYMDNNEIKADTKIKDEIKKTEKCDCKNGKVSYDGGTSWTDCPKCKPAGDTPPEPEPVQAEAPKKIRLILITDQQACPPCRLVKANVVDRLKNEAHKKAGWTVGVEETDKLQVLDIRRDIDAIEKLNLDFNSVPTLIRYNSDDEPIVGVFTYKEFLRYYHGGNKIPFYSGNGSTEVKISGDNSESTIISHLRDGSHPEVANWPLEILSREDLLKIHNDVHVGKVGKIEWK